MEINGHKLEADEEEVLYMAVMTLNKQAKKLIDKGGVHKEVGLIAQENTAKLINVITKPPKTKKKKSNCPRCSKGTLRLSMGGGYSCNKCEYWNLGHE